jgi:hypothetical protein
MGYKKLLAWGLISGSSLAYGGQPNIEEDPMAVYIIAFADELGLGFEYRFSEQVGLRTEAIMDSIFGGGGTNFVYFPKGFNGWNVGVGTWYIKRNGWASEHHCYSKIEGSGTCSPGTENASSVPYKSIDTRIGIGWATGETLYFGVDAGYFMKTIYIGPSHYPEDIAKSDKRRYSESLKNGRDPIYQLAFNIGFRF